MLSITLTFKTEVMNLNHNIFGTALIVLSTIMTNAQSSTQTARDPTLPSSKANLEKLISYDKKETLNTKSKTILQDLKLHLKSLLTGNIFPIKKKDQEKKKSCLCKGPEYRKKLPKLL